MMVVDSDTVLRRDLTALIREAAADHFYGPWQGGGKAAGGRPGGEAGGGGFVPAASKNKNDDRFFAALKADSAIGFNPRSWYREPGARPLPAGVTLKDLYPEQGITMPAIP